MSDFYQSEGYLHIAEWMKNQGRMPFDFQKNTWERYADNYNGMVVAPTGFGKTYSVFLAVVIDSLNRPEAYPLGLNLLWITPLRALAKDIALAMQTAIENLYLDWTVGVRNGDTPIAERKAQTKQMPRILVLTPESLHLLLAQKNHESYFQHLACIAVDEWHELLGSKRGVMTELAITRILSYKKNIRIWGITATIGNIDDALNVLISKKSRRTKIIAKEEKKIEIQSILPDTVETLPWAGHLGIRMADKLVPIILESQSTLIFTNTRNQAEMWYQALLDVYPDFAGVIAIHHSSIDAEIRQWIEENLSQGKLKAVISTSSLDLGVDFKSVDTVIHIGSSKGVARFLQRAGRSGHSPFETSLIYFLPTYSLELVEVSALKEAVKDNDIESREPILLAYDVLVQFMVTLAVGSGFHADRLWKQIKATYTYRDLQTDEWNELLLLITQGGKSLHNYQEYHKVENEKGFYKVTQRRIAMLHRLNMGVIVSETMLQVKFLKGGYIGMVEEFFITKLKRGDKFILAGRVLEYVLLKDMTVLVRLSSGKAIAPSWLGGRLPLTSSLSYYLRKQLSLSLNPPKQDKELNFLQPLFQRQVVSSIIPKSDEFLVEFIQTKEGYHLFLYPFEGRLIHEVMSSLIAYRLAKRIPNTFTIAMNDYGFELLSSKPFELNEDILRELLSLENLMQDVTRSINAAELAKRKFRDIAIISGLIYQNYPKNRQKTKSLQASSGIIFNVLSEFEPNHILLRQAYVEVFNQQLEEPRLIAAFQRIQKSKLIFVQGNQFTPLSFPIKVDSLRHSLSTEDLQTRVLRLQKEAEEKSKKYDSPSRTRKKN